MNKSWKNLEDHVRGVASLRWNTTCQAEHIDGVDFDAVVRLSDEELILIEITEERTLEKVRADIAKILPTKIRLGTTGLICRAFVVLDEAPTLSMVEAGKKAHITVTSSHEFERAFFDFSAYRALRLKLPFGSAVDSKTGENDKRQFIPVRYDESGGSAVLTVTDLAAKLIRGTKIALTGDFGTGKSRCVHEVFSLLSEKVREAGAFPIAINLRDHWSSSNALEILAGHLGNVGLSNSIDNLVRLMNSGALILLLDGFDEIGAQTHDVRVEDRCALRRRAVQGVRDLIQRARAGVLVTGRSHFFDSDSEMLQSLGLASNKDTAHMFVPEHFTQLEAEQYFKALGIDVPVPAWLPRKPLVFQILVELDKEDVARILKKEHGKFEFWGTFINAVCVRESKGVGESIAPQTIRFILLELAAKTRYADSFLGRLSPRDIDDAYERVIGSSPDETGRQLLARMCMLGRIEPESPDRQFVDAAVVDILRCERLLSEIVAMRDEDSRRQWSQSLRSMGIVHAASSVYAFDLGRLCFSYLKKFATSGNTKRLGEIVSILSVAGESRLDFQGLQLIRSELPILNVSSCTVTNLAIKESIIEFLALQSTPVTDQAALLIEDSFISVAAGVSDASGLPAWIRNSEVIRFDALSNAARIKESSLSPPQRLFLAIVHKIFFQPGAGREEAALLKGGYGQKYSPKLVDSILKLMLREKVVERFKGDEGWVYKPMRRFTERMSKIKAELTLSEDSLWKDVSTLSE